MAGGQGAGGNCAGMDTKRITKSLIKDFRGLMYGAGGTVQSLTLKEL